MKTRFSVLTYEGHPKNFEAYVEKFLEDKTLISANFQRNLFYPRRNMEFNDDLQQTYTAFILWKEG